MSRPTINIDELTAGERFALIEELWDSLRARLGAFPMTAEEQETIEARRAAHRRDPSTAASWETVRAELESDQNRDDQTNARGSRGTG